MAVAQTTDSKFGYGESAITVSKPLMLMNSLPRFVRIGDKIEAGAVIHNYTGSLQKITLTIKADAGIVFTSATTTNIMLSNNRSQEVRFRFTVANQIPDYVKFTITARSGSYSDGLEIPVPVRNPKIYETMAIYDKTTGSMTQRVNVTEAVIPELSRISDRLPRPYELDGCVDTY
jgi:uncharacterized protein YfaS (alpha-2-macroglobulin family)